MIQTFAFCTSLISAFLFVSCNHAISSVLSIFNIIALFSVGILFFNICFLILSVNKKLLQWGFVVLVFLTSFLLVLQIKDRYVITPEILYAVLFQDGNEMFDFVSLTDLITPLISCFICYFVFRFRSKIYFKINKRYLTTALCLVFINIFMVFFVKVFTKKHLYTQKKNLVSLVAFVKDSHLITPINFFYSLIITVSSVINNSDETLLPINIKTAEGDANKNLKVYYIIGESARFDRFSINGYQKTQRQTLKSILKQVI